MKEWDYIKEFCLNAEGLSVSKMRKLDACVESVDKKIKEFEKQIKCEERK